MIFKPRLQYFFFKFFLDGFSFCHNIFRAIFSKNKLYSLNLKEALFYQIPFGIFKDEKY